MGKSVSVTLGKGSLRHNNRGFYTKNVDPSLSANNVCFIKQSLKSAYDEIFGEALERYNKKQTRNDRKISSYLDHIQKSKNKERPFHELVVQVGNRDDTGIRTKDADTAREILTEYYHDFLTRNPNMKVFNAVLHMDETDGTPHLHIDFIPIATGQKRGLEVRNSLSQALKQQGFTFTPTPKLSEEKSHCNTSGPRFVSGQWLEAERKALGAVLEKHGIKWEKKGIHREHLSIPEYKACAEIVNNTVKEMVSPEVNAREPGKILQLAGVKSEELIVNRSDLEAVKDESKLLRSQVKLTQEALCQAQNEKRESEIKAENYVAQAKRKYSVEKVENYYKLYNENSFLIAQRANFMEQYKGLQEENEKLKKSQDTIIEHEVRRVIAPVQEENSRLQKELSRWKQKAEELQECIRYLCHFILDTMRAVFTLKYRFKGGHPNPCLSELSEPGSKLIDALEENARHALQKADHSELEDELDGMGLTPQLSAEIGLTKQRKRNVLEH